ncbi:hypothetical protein BIW11_11255 [Tropilaelaps mercedesae]|uniref:Degenerin del-1-like n=1 Tax=Tropilaelaps mercedesae TaxID=418985 RepID=A0A1V9XCE9_9ACAR|nr:hypothetical protein BIW11_11255 [Tropilaelaps mercedesae]
MYFEYPFSVTMFEEILRNSAVTAQKCIENRRICQLHAHNVWNIMTCRINTTRLCNVRPASCSSVNDLFAPTGYNYFQFDVVGRLGSAHHPTELLSCFMRSSVSSCESYECQEYIEMTYYRQPDEMCYTVDMYRKTKNNKEHPLNKCRTPWNYGLTLSGHWDPKVTWGLRSVDTLPLIIHRPSIVPPERLSSIMIEPGMDYTISVTQNKIRRLPAPYSSRCADYQSMGEKETFYGYLNQDPLSADALCAQVAAASRQVANGRDSDWHKTSTKCTSTEWARSKQGEAAAFRCVVYSLRDICERKLQKIAKAYDKCDKKCGPACDEVLYDVRLTSLAEDRKEDSKNSFQCTIKFASYSQKVLEYQPVLSIVEMFGYMGGYIGIWLGFSLLSVLLTLNKFLWNLHEQRRLKTRV